MTKQKQRTWMMTGMFISGGVLGFLSKALAPLPPITLAVIYLVTLVLVSWAAFYCWSLLDEAQKEAHKWAWYWGGSTGLGVSLIAVFLALRFDPHLAEAIRPNGSSSAYVQMGLLAAAGSTVIGYGLAWAGWWIARR